MAKIIPNDQTWIGFATTIASGTLVPTAAEVTAAANLTGFCISLNASSQGNVVPTASFTADFYRDDTADTAWNAFDRGDAGFFIISRFGGAGTGNKPVAADVVEVWPVQIVSKANSNLQNNTVQTFTVNCSIPQEPNENATVSA
jgi:hypothetical protein